MRTKAGMPTTTIVIISIVIMLVATILIFMLLPTIEDEFGKPGACEDTCYNYQKGPITDRYEDCQHPQRYIIHWHDGDDWQYYDGFEGFTSNKYDSLHDLRNGVRAAYEGNQISEGSWHWFDCTAGAIS